MKIWMRTSILVIAAVLSCCGIWQCRQERMVEEIAGKVIRFHVLANSDAQADQDLKLKVRDAVGSFMQPKLSGVSDINASRQAVKENLSGIEETAQEVIAQEGYTYDVQASLTVTDFPEKTYGDYTFPAGKYEALEVVIGDGGGHNWWCVMYPNLCFFNSVYEVVDDEAKESLQRALTPEEYKSLMENKNYEVKFALVEKVKELLGK
jgi:stage II sporulation protein R